ncbi:MAG: NADH-quinone oxidoreductase subunit NuoK [Candidatus Hatepunaea meridiana]|nr:NADH-quinone oxidoreductase subunit NuoK [Candidatus Hatepunaea meridiana]
MHDLNVYLFISGALFLLGLLAVITRKNAVSVLMGIELILNSAGLNFVAFSHFSTGNLSGQAAALFVIIVAAAEAAVALAVFLNIYRLKGTSEVNKVNILQG